MALWTPAEITTAFWGRPEDSSTVTIETGIKILGDKSANNRNAVQNTTSAQPALTSGGLNSQDVATFDGSSDNLSIADTAGLQFGTGDFAVLAVCSMTNVSKGTTSQNTIISKNYTGFELYNYQGNITCFVGGTSNSPAGIAISSNVPFIAGFTRLSGSLRMRLNGTPGTAVTNTASASQIGTALSLGVRAGNGSSFLGGLLAELIILPAGFTVDQYEMCEGYLAWDWGLVSSLRSDHPYKSAAPTIPDITSIRAILDQLYALEGSPRALLAQDWNLMLSLRNVVNQDWSLRILQALTQYYGDVPVVRQLLEQYWGPAAMLRRLVAQPYGDALRLRAGLDQDWGLNAGLLAMMEQRYSVAGDRYLALAEQAYNIKDTELIQKLLDQVYIIQPSGITLQKPVTSVTASATSLFPQKTLHPYHIEIEVDEEEFAIKGEIHLADEAEWISCVHVETELTIPIDGTEYHLLVEGPWKSRQPGLTEYYVPMASKTILLDAPYADGLEKELGGKMASVIVQDLADMENITVDWDMIDWFIPVGALYANGETPLAVIRKIVGAAGGVLQSSPAGDLICRAEYPITVPNWSTASPDFYLTDSDNFFSVSSKPDIRDGFNRFSISDQDEGTQGLTPEEVPINSTTKHILVYQIPFKSTDTIVLRTSGGTWVGVISEGVVTEDILDEQVEIVGGEGNTTKPIYGIIGLPDYKEAELGVITTSESGVISTAILENSLVNISYTTKYRKFIVTDPNIEDVQFFPEIQP